MIRCVFSTTIAPLDVSLRNSESFNLGFLRLGFAQRLATRVFRGVLPGVTKCIAGHLYIVVNFILPLHKFRLLWARSRFLKNPLAGQVPQVTELVVRRVLFGDDFVAGKPN